jgi:hypothetical protein
MRAFNLAFGLFTALLLISAAGSASVAAEPLLVLERSIPLAGVSGRIDHMAVDEARRRLFVAELANNSVDVVDLAAAKVVHRIGGLKAPQSVAYLAEQDILVVASAGDGTVRFYRGADFSPLGSLALGSNADNIRIDRITGHILVGHGDGALAVVDPTAQVKLGDINLAAHPESFQIDTDARRAYVNVPDAQQIAVVDLVLRQQVSVWRTPGLAANFAMAFTSEDLPLAVVFRRPAKIAFLAQETGMMMQTLDTCGDADDVFFDARRARLYVSCGAGAIDVIKHGAAGFQRAARIKTAKGARTSLFVPHLDRLFVATRARGTGTTAAILVFRPLPK